jgi:hypothetical protein
MKPLSKCITIFLLASCRLFACSFYPYQEDFRFSFFKPGEFDYHTYSGFEYDAMAHEPSEPYNDADIHPNIASWMNYCKQHVSAKAVIEAVYTMPQLLVNATSDNDMVRYLSKQKDTAAINYLNFAKRCESLNEFFSDPWERQESVNPLVRGKIINKAIAKSKNTKNKFLKNRYAFLAIRMCFYQQDTSLLLRVFDENFNQKNSEHNYIYYCALHYRSLFETNSASANFMVAQVFCNAPEKRWAAFNAFARSVEIDEVIKYAHNNIEKANVYQTTATFQLNKALDNIRKMYELNPQTDALEFLLQREINKLEDWVYTPYYSLFSPSVNQSVEYDETEDEKTILDRAEKDRLYAQDLVQFISKVPSKTFTHPTFLPSAIAHLYFISKKYDNCKQQISVALKAGVANDSIGKVQLEKLSALVSIAEQNKSEVQIRKDIQPTLLKNEKDIHFIFAMAREIEYKGNKPLASLLFSKVVGNEYEEATYWSMRKVFAKDNWSYYYYYFDYLNYEYEPLVIESALHYIDEHKSENDFNKWLCSKMAEDQSILLDLIGTKYIRKNDLKKAQLFFNKIPSSFWSSGYGGWEESSANGTNVFDKNPFYTLKYTPDFITKRDTFLLTKKTITDRLITLLEKVENPKTKNKDYYYFIIANCYYNMSFEGNIWMMRRFNKSCYMILTNLEDDDEYYEARLAQHYYELAMQHSRKKMFKALCLRMMARCERDKNNHIAELKSTNAENSTNKFAIELQRRYPKYYDDLVNSSCGFFEEYFSGKKPS